MPKIYYLPLSVNKAWKGQRFKTDQYKQYERDLLFLLPKFTMPEKPYSIILNFGMSSLGQDIDNGIKMFLDILQKKYAFNDNQVMQLHVYKTKTEKGKEFINFTIEHCVV